MNGAELLSTQVMQSDPSIVRSSLDLHAQMSVRKERLSFLIKFINDNAVLTKMSQRSRQKLATDAEKLYAAHQLWLRHNEVLAYVLTITFAVLVAHVLYYQRWNSAWCTGRSCTSVYGEQRPQQFRRSHASFLQNPC